MIIGYARVSTNDQNPELQVDALEKAGAEQIFQEKFTGTLKERPELSQCLRMLRRCSGRLETGSVGAFPKRLG